MVGKLKAPKEQTKREKSENRGRRSKEESAKTKTVNVKEKRTARNSKKKKIERKRTDSQSSKDSDHGVGSDPLFEDHADVFRLKGKKKVSKECEEAVLHAVSDFFDSAWLACAERFFITSAPVNVSYELRNTWLRIMEAEYQDTGIKGKVLSDKINKVFHSDEPPLPLAYDTWSRGAIELLPRVKRESVLDPFLREFDAAGRLLTDKSWVSHSSSTTLATMDYKNESEKTILPSEQTLPSSVPIDKTKDLGETEELSSSAGEGPKGDNWNFALDEKDSMTFTPGDTTTTATSDNRSRSSLGSNLSAGGDIQEKLLHILYTTETFPKDDSKTEIDSTASTSVVRYVNSTSTTAEHFSPSQCGGKNGSGVFRLYGERTSEALLRSVTQSEGEDSTNEYSRERSDLVERSAEDHEDIVHISRKIKEKDDYDSDVGLEVHPLFQDADHTPRPRSTTKSIHHLQDVWRRDPYSDKRLDVVASDITKEFTTRRILNLHGRFRRQALRSMAARIKAAEGSGGSRSRRTSSGAGDSKSLTSIGGSTKGRRKSDRKSIPHSVSNQSVNMRSKSMKAESPSFFVNRLSAKGTVSAPQLVAHKKELVQKQQKFPLRHVESKRLQRSFSRNKSQSPHDVKRNKTNSNRSIARGQSQSPHNPKKVNAASNRNFTRDKSQSPHSTKRDTKPSTRNFARDQSHSPHNAKKNNTPSNRNFSKDKSQSPHNTRRDNTPSNRNFTRNKSKSPQNVRKDYVSSNIRNIQSNARSSRSLTSKRPSRGFMSMGNVRSSNKTDLISKAGKSEPLIRQAPNQFQFASENRRKFEPGSIELQGKPWKKVQQEEPGDCASTTSDCSVKASLERVR